MKIWARLPRDRELPGEVWVTELGGDIVFGPAACRGEADTAQAASHANPQEDPTQPFGDHPGGISLVTDIVVTHPSDAKKFRSYGPAFFALRPVSGEAWRARENGRTGLAIHGGDPAPNGSLRPTWGCLRVSNETAVRLADLIRPEWKLNRTVFYECLIEGQPLPEVSTS